LDVDLDVDVDVDLNLDLDLNLDSTQPCARSGCDLGVRTEWM